MKEEAKEPEGNGGKTNLIAVRTRRRWRFVSNPSSALKTSEIFRVPTFNETYCGPGHGLPPTLARTWVTAPAMVSRWALQKGCPEAGKWRQVRGGQNPVWSVWRISTQCGQRWLEIMARGRRRRQQKHLLLACICKYWTQFFTAMHH